MKTFELELPSESRTRKKHLPPTASRMAVGVFFFANGMLFGTWVSRIPAVQVARGLSHGALGLALLAIALGALISMPLTGRLTEKLGSHWITRASVVLYAALLPLVALAPGIPLWVATLFLFGMSHGALDVAMNAQAVEVENRYARAIMSSFHALFSAGGLAGAVIGGCAATAGITPLVHFIAASAGLLGLTAALAFRHLIDDRRGIPKAESHPTPKRFRLPQPGLLAIGLVAFCAMMGEGAMADWSGIFLRNNLGATEGLAAAGYAAFSVTMAVTRFFGDSLATRLGPVGSVRLSGVLATSGLAVALLSPAPWIAMLGFGFVGAGFATVVPMAFSAAGRTPGVSSGVALATATTVGYFGFLIGPPLIGLVAEWIGLRGGLALILGTSALIVAFASAVRGGTPDSI
jgi:predicted MFS family arabinose efflux permease